MVCVLVLGGLLALLALAIVVPFVTSRFANTTLPPEAVNDNVIDFLRRRFGGRRRRG
jgi:hypothetical protein